ncbi:MAG: acylphosphatase [Clostridia bacterium]|nr:acylphosphatase [Clostridia bacterium]
MVRYHIIVHGRVQGVGFRYYVQEKAYLYGIRGWVKNRFDGTVEIEAEGEEENFRLFLESVREGPRFAYVENLEINKMADLKNYERFAITF